MIENIKICECEFKGVRIIPRQDYPPHTVKPLWKLVKVPKIPLKQCVDEFEYEVICNELEVSLDIYKELQKKYKE